MNLQERIADYHRLRFPTDGPLNVALKAAEEVGEVCSAVNGMVSDGDFGKGDVVREVAHAVFTLFALMGRWFPDHDLLAEVDLTRYLDPNGDHRSCLPQEAVDAEHWADWQTQQ